MPPLPPIELVRDALYYLILPEFAIAFLVLALVYWRGGAKHAPAGAAIGLLLAVTLGSTLGHWLHNAVSQMLPSDGDAPSIEYGFWLTGVLKPMPNESTWNRLPWAALAALCVGRLTRLTETVSTDAWLVRGAASFAIAWWLIPERTVEIGNWVVPGVAMTILLNWMTLDCLASKPSDGSVPICLCMCFFVASLVLLQAAFASLSESAIMIGSAFFAFALFAYWRGVDVSGAIPAAVLLPGLLLIGHEETVAELPLAAYVLAALAPVMLVLALPFMQWPAFGRLALRLTLIAIPLGFAAWLVLAAVPLQFE